jgi:hypothetical protein
LPPKHNNDSRTQDNKNDQYIQSLPTVVGTDRDRVHVRLESNIPQYYSDGDFVVMSEPRLLGVSFGVGSYMNQEEF